MQLEELEVTGAEDGGGVSGPLSGHHSAVLRTKDSKVIPLRKRHGTCCTVK